MRELQFTKDGKTMILEHEEALKIVQKHISTHMAMEAIMGGIPFIADGGEYVLLGNPMGI